MDFETFKAKWSVELVLCPLGGDLEIEVARHKGIEKEAFDFLNTAKNLPVTLDQLDAVAENFALGLGNGEQKLKFTRRKATVGSEKK